MQAITSQQKATAPAGAVALNTRDESRRVTALPQIVRLQRDANLLQGLILNLADALLGDTDDLPDLLERERSRVGVLLDLLPQGEPVSDHLLLDVGQLGPVLADDLP